MGNPLSVSVSDLTLGHFESTLFLNCPARLKPLMYWRFVDDIFLVFDKSLFPEDFSKEDIVREFVDFLHSHYRNTKIRFTFEIESENSLAFLDILVTRVSTGQCRLQRFIVSLRSRIGT